MKYVLQAHAREKKQLSCRSFAGVGFVARVKVPPKLLNVSNSFSTPNRAKTMASYLFATLLESPRLRYRMHRRRPNRPLTCKVSINQLARNSEAAIALRNYTKFKIEADVMPSCKPLRHWHQCQTKLLKLDALSRSKL